MSAVDPGLCSSRSGTGVARSSDSNTPNPPSSFANRKVSKFKKFDLEIMSLTHDRTFDVAITMEVAEHLPETSADHFVMLLTSLSNLIVFTAAPPGQHGIDHINEQPPSYWISRFQEHDFEHDETMSSRWKQAW
jgi:hypothetical protein